MRETVAPILHSPALGLRFALEHSGEKAHIRDADFSLMWIADLAGNEAPLLLDGD